MVCCHAAQFSKCHLPDQFASSPEHSTQSVCVAVSACKLNDCPCRMRIPCCNSARIPLCCRLLGHGLVCWNCLRLIGPYVQLTGATCGHPLGYSCPNKFVNDIIEGYVTPTSPCLPKEPPFFTSTPTTSIPNPAHRPTHIFPPHPCIPSLFMPGFASFH